jgi:hypothetical protein
VALAGSVYLLAAGCGLILDFDPPDARHLECFATVENAEGVRVEVSSLSHPDFIRGAPTFRGGGGGGGGGGGTVPIRPYYVCTAASCGPCFHRTTTDAEADWRRWLAQRIGEVAATADSASLFRMHPGPWCVVPGTVRCEMRETMDRNPDCGEALTAAPLADCAPTPPGDRCLEVSCRGVAPCTAIDYGLHPTGARVPETVTLRNCGAAGEQPVRIQVDPMVMPITLDADFTVTRNDCAPRTPMEVATGRLLQLPSVDPAESTCSLELTFAPTRSGLHEGTTAFSSDVDPSHRIRLLGQVEGGGLSLDRTSVYCLDPAPPGSCSPEGIVRVTNGGPGTVTITDMRFDVGGGNFFVRRPPPPPFPITLAPGDPPLEVALQWCPGGAGEVGGELTIDSNADPPLEPLKVGHRDPENCPP